MWLGRARTGDARTRSDGRRHEAPNYKEQAPNRKEQRHDGDHLLLWTKAGMV